MDSLVAPPGGGNARDVPHVSHLGATLPSISPLLNLLAPSYLIVGLLCPSWSHLDSILGCPRSPETSKNIDFPYVFSMFLENTVLSTCSTVLTYSGPFWLHLGPVLGPLWASLEPPWGGLGALLAPLGPCGATLGRSCFVSWRYLAVYLASLGHRTSILAQVNPS